MSDYGSPPATDLKGLTSEEAARRLAAEGANELTRAARRGLPHVLREVLGEPMFGLLLATGFTYLLLGDKAEALLVSIFACLSVGIVVIQQTRSERVLEALRDLTSPRALVIRDGARQRIPGREVVRGDLIVLAEGDRVPADARLAEAAHLEVDEAILTGESVPAGKQAWRPELDAVPSPGGDDLPFVFSGTLVVRGQAVAEAYATGGNSEIGKIGNALRNIESSAPRLSLQMAHLVRVSAAIGGFCCLLVTVLYGMLRGTWLNALLAGLSLGMAMLPEEFPLVLSVFMVMGAWRISQSRVLTRRAAAIETLGEATVLCTDKTGTLTENRMTVVALHDGSETVEIRDSAELPPRLREIAEVGALASAPEAWDPMDRAFQALARQTGDEPRVALLGS